MAHETQRSLEIEALIAAPLFVAAMFPAVIAQRRGPLWLQAAAICIMLPSGIVAVRAAILLKPYRQQSPALSKRAWRAYALIIALVLTFGLGAIALVAKTSRAWFFFASFIILGVLIFAQKWRERV
jgi:hypothetical protein